jgi:hypothetical protein
MPSREFKSFSELIEYRSICQICSNKLEYEISATIIPFSNDNKKYNILKSIDYVPSNQKPEEISIKFDPTETEIINIEKLNTRINIPNNSLTGNFDASLSFFNLKLSCSNPDLKVCEYEASGDFESTDSEIKNNEDGTYIFGIAGLQIYHEIYKFYSVEEQIGKHIKIINDYNISKTSFFLVETSIDGSNSHNYFQEKRIHLVDDDYFKFENTKKIFSRIDSIFLLADK